MIELRNDGSGFGFGISGSRNSGAVVRNIFPGGAADRVSEENKYSSALYLLCASLGGPSPKWRPFTASWRC